MPTSRHVFLSYCRDDKPRVKAIRDELVKNGLKVWWDDQIRPGGDWKHEIREAMRFSYAVVVCFSKNFANRKHSGVYPEILDAIGVLRELHPGEIFIIPVRLSSCEIPDIEIDPTRTLKHLNHVDLFPDSTRKRELQKLILALQQRASAHIDGEQQFEMNDARARVTITINFEYDSFDKHYENILRYGLAGFLGVDIDQVSIIAIEKGSVRVTIELPESAVKVLLRRWSETAFADAVNGLPVEGIQSVEQPVKTGESHVTKANLELSNLFVLAIDAGIERARRGDYRASVAQLSTIFAKLGNTNHSAAFRAQIELAKNLRKLGRYDEGLSLLQTMLTNLRALWGNRHLLVASTLSEIGELHFDRGQVAQASEAFREALAIRQDLVGEGHPLLAKSISALGVLANSGGRYAEARSLLERALAIQERLPSPDPVDLAETLSNLAAVMKAEGYYDETFSLLHRAIALLERSLGPDHPELAAALINSANFYLDLDLLDEAERLYQRVLGIQTTTMGPTSIELATTKANLAVVYLDRKHYSRAESLFQDARATYEELLPPDHPDLGILLNNLAALYQRIGRQQEASQLHLRARNILKSGLRSTHFDRTGANLSKLITGEEV